jgi:hypothetical protein
MYVYPIVSTKFWACIILAYQAEVAWREHKGYSRDALLDSIVEATRGKEDAISTMLLELWQRRSTYPRDAGRRQPAEGGG